MTSLILTIMCSSSIALILKHNDTRSGNALILLAGNYLMASLISFLFWVMQRPLTIHLVPIIFGSLLGLMFILSFFSFARSVTLAGTALATISSRLSVVIPTGLSIFIFRELPGNYQWLGYVLALLTLYLFYLSLKKSHAGKLSLKVYLYLFMVFAGIGINDFSLKLFNQYRPAQEKQLFLLAIFFSAFIYCIVIIKMKHVNWERRSFFRGAVLGIPNMLSSLFLINALLALPAVLVYPVTNIGIIILTLVAAFIIWRERLNRFGALALASGTVAIVLMSI